MRWGQVVAVSGPVTAPSGIYIVQPSDSIVMTLSFRSFKWKPWLATSVS